MKILTKNILINSRKFDDSIGKSWTADLIKKRDSLLIFKGVFDREIIHSHLGVIRPGTISIEYYWLDRWHNVFKFHEPGGAFRNFYCNINKPPTFENGILNYVDLDIDVIVWKDFSIDILDMDEFEINSKKFNYSSKLKRNADLGLATILQDIKAGNFPFDTIDGYL